MGSNAGGAKGVALAHLCDVSRRLWQRRLLGSYIGGCGLRSEGELWTRQASASNANLKPTEVVPLKLGLWPGSALIYEALKARPEAGAAILMASPATTALAIAGEIPADTLWAASASILGSVALVECALLEDEPELSRLRNALEDAKAVLLSHAGALVLGRDCEDAYHRAEVLDLTADSLILTRQIGSERPLSASAFDHYLKHGLNAQLEDVPSVAMQSPEDEA